MGRLDRSQRGEIRILDDDPPAYPYRRHQPLERPVGVWQVTQDCPAVREIIPAGFQGIGTDIVPPHLDVGQLQRGQEARIDVGGDDPPLGADLLGQPADYGAMASPDFQTPPAFLEAQRGQMSLRTCVFALLPQSQAVAFSRVCGLAQYILLLSHDALPLDIEPDTCLTG